MKHAILYMSIMVIFTLIACAPEPLTPTSTPKPTWTLKPHGILQACIYYDGDQVDLGYLTFKDESGKLEDLDSELVGGCKDIVLPPGNYEVSPHYYQGDCSSSSAICRPREIYQIDISVGEIIAVDFEVFLPE